MNPAISAQLHRLMNVSDRMIVQLQQAAGRPRVARRRRFSFVLVLTVAGLLVWSPGATAVASVTFKALPGIVSSYTSVSDRFIVYGQPEVAQRRITVVDTKRLTTRRYVLPADCRLYSTSGGGGPPVAGGRALFSCEARDVVLDLRDGTFTSVAKPPRGSDWFDLGTRWLEVPHACSSTSDRSRHCATFANLLTGEVRTLDVTDVAYDLDSEHLDPVVVCAPFGAQKGVARDRWQVWGQYVYLDREPMEIGRCGHRTPTRLGGEYASTSTASLVGGWATYFNDRGCSRVAYAYRPSVKRTYRWTTPVVKRAKCIGDVIHTRYAIVVPLIAKVTQNLSEEDFTYRLVIRRLPS